MPDARVAIALAGTALVAAWTTAAGAQQTTPNNQNAVAARAAMTRAESSLQAGDLRGAARGFALVLELVPPTDTPSLARAHYGRALAAQRLLAGTDTLEAWSAAGALADYDAARTLDSARFFAVSSNNAAVLLRAAGDARRAATYFLAATSDSTLRPQALANAARALEAAGDSVAATSVYRQAQATDAKNAGVEAAILRLDGAVAPESLVAVVSRWAADPASAHRVPNAVVTALASDRWRRGPTAVSDSLIVLLAAYFASADVPPEWFAGAPRAGLTRVAESNPYLRDCLSALIDAYAARPAAESYVEPPTVDWWRATTGRQRAWSRMLRSIGETHERAGREELAASYYAAAIGFRYARGTLEEVSRVPHEAVDYGAVLPLALILAHRGDGSGLDRLDDFENFVFNQKSAAYSSNDLVRVRLFHQTLGALYAARGQWRGAGARSALFQLDRMRSTTRELARRDSSLVDPPELLESLVRAYLETGEPRQALGVMPDLARSYARFGWPSDSARVLAIVASKVTPVRTVVTARDARAPSTRWQQWDAETWSSSEGTGASRVTSFTLYSAGGTITVDGVAGTRLVARERGLEAFIPNSASAGATVLRRRFDGSVNATGAGGPWVPAGRVTGGR